LADWVFGDFQSLKPNPDEHRIQPIEASQLVNVGTEMSLHVLAYNLKRVINILGIAKTLKAVSSMGA